VDCKYIESIINADEELELGRKVAGNTGHDAKYDGCPWGDKARARGNGNEARDSARAEANSAPLLLQAVVQNRPGEAGNASSEVGNNARHNGTYVGAQSRTAIEAEPANPEEDGSEDDVRDVVRAVGETVVLVIADTAPEHHAVRERSDTRIDVDRAATGKVEVAEGEEPTVGIPRPISNRVIDDSSPDEDENTGRQHTPTVRDGADGESRRDGSEHALEQAEEDVGNPA